MPRCKAPDQMSQGLVKSGRERDNMNKELGRMVRGRATMGKGMERQKGFNLDVTTWFWTHLFESADKDGDVLKVGDYRCAPINDFWAVLAYGAAFPVQSFMTRQEALDWMVSVECNKFADAKSKADAVRDSWSEIKQSDHATP